MFVKNVNVLKRIEKGRYIYFCSDENCSFVEGGWSTEELGCNEVKNLLKNEISNKMKTVNIKIDNNVDYNIIFDIDDLSCIFLEDNLSGYLTKYELFNISDNNKKETYFEVYLSQTKVESFDRSSIMFENTKIKVKNEYLKQYQIGIINFCNETFLPHLDIADKLFKENLKLNEIKCIIYFLKNNFNNRIKELPSKLSRTISIEYINDLLSKKVQVFSSEDNDKKCLMIRLI